MPYVRSGTGLFASGALAFAMFAAVAVAPRAAHAEKSAEQVKCEEGGGTGFHTADDAVRLAAGFRALALLLAAILARAGRIARWLRREARARAGLPTVRRKPVEPQGRTVRYAARGPPPSRVRTEITPP